MNAIDQSVHTFFQTVHASWLTYGFYMSTWFFNTIPAVILVLLVTYFLFRWSNKRNVIEFLSAISISFMLVWIIKLYINHPRPEFGIITAYGPGFPSAHAAVATTFFLFFLRFMRHEKNIFRRVVHQMFCVLVPVSVAISRLYLGVHWLSDVLVGIVVGIGALIMSRYIWKKFYTHTFFTD